MTISFGGEGFNGALSNLQSKFEYTAAVFLFLISHVSLMISIRRLAYLSQTGPIGFECFYGLRKGVLAFIALPRGVLLMGPPMLECLL